MILKAHENFMSLMDAATSSKLENIFSCYKCLMMKKVSRGGEFDIHEKANAANKQHAKNAKLLTQLDRAARFL